MPEVPWREEMGPRGRTSRIVVSALVVGAVVFLTLAMVLVAQGTFEPKEDDLNALRRDTPRTGALIASEAGPQTEARGQGSGSTCIRGTRSPEPRTLNPTNLTLLQQLSETKHPSPKISQFFTEISDQRDRPTRAER